MNRVFVTGDVHGEVQKRFSSRHFHIGVSLDRDDLIFIAGDFGVIFDDNAKAMKLRNHRLDWLNDKPWTTMVVGGNHENWDTLRALPIVEKFGVKLGKIRENIFFVPNGTLIEYHGRKIFTMGGARSVDRTYREKYEKEWGIKIWWNGEIPLLDEMDFGVRNLERAAWKVDHVITHTMPIAHIHEYMMKYGVNGDRTTDPTANYLTFLWKFIKYKSWFCGHFHGDHEINGINILYHTIVDMDSNKMVATAPMEPLW